MSACNRNSSKPQQPTTESGILGGSRVQATVLVVLSLVLWPLAVNANTLTDSDRYRVVTQVEQTPKTLEQAIAQLRTLSPPSRVSERKALYFSLVTTNPIWFLTPIPSQTRYIVISNGWQDYYEIALVAGTRVIARYPAGSLVPASQRPVADPRWVIPIPDGYDNLDLVLHDRSAGASLAFPIEFQSEQEYSRALRLLHLQHGAYYGLLLILLCISIGAAIASLHIATIYFIFYLVGAATLLGGQDGFLGFYLFPNSPILVTALTHICLGVVIANALLFGIHFLDMKRIAPRLARAAQWLAIAALVQGLLIAWLRSQETYVMEMAASILAGLVLIAAAVIGIRHKVEGAGIFLVGRIPNLASSIILITNNWFTQGIEVNTHALFIGTGLEILIISGAILLRINAEQRAVAASQGRERELGDQLDQLQLITDESIRLREVQHSVQEIHRLRTINQIAGGVAHDFNNILTSVMGFAELLKDPKLKLSAEQRHKYGSEIYQAGGRGADLVQQLLIYSRSATPNATPLDMISITQEALNLAHAGLPNGIEPNANLPGSPLICALDANQWRQVVVNLVTNAAEAMSGSGTVDVTIEQKWMPPQQCSSCHRSLSGERIILTIRDQGCGVEEPVSDWFTPFHTPKPVGNGSGLGLSVVDGIVHEHGGHLVMAKSLSGTGTEVFVALPWAQQHEAVSQEQVQLLLVSSGSAGIAAAQSKLERYYEATVVERPSAAISTFLDNHARFGLVVIEVQPNDSRWLEVASNVRRVNPNAPILFLTADHQTSQALKQNDQLQHSEATQILNLESDIDSLLTTVETLLNPGAEKPQNIASLRQTLRRLKKPLHA